MVRRNQSARIEQDRPPSGSRSSRAGQKQVSSGSQDTSLDGRNSRVCQDTDKSVRTKQTSPSGQNSSSHVAGMNEQLPDRGKEVTGGGGPGNRIYCSNVVSSRPTAAAIQTTRKC
ncbi:uncharacterized protein V6R79_022835 [Siganus canaliculatus]